MQCPVCVEVQLSMTDRQGVEIDYCPKCRGVWLDRGELDKIIERNQRDLVPSPVPSQPVSSGQPYDTRRAPEPKHGGHHGSSHGGFLRRLFD
jgi:Zn-finger nucleic acid-binding protein